MNNEMIDEIVEEKVEDVKEETSEEVIEDVTEEVVENIEEENVDEVQQEESTETEIDTEQVQEEKEDKIQTIQVDEPTNLEAIVEGLLYIVGEDGAKLEQISLAIEKSQEDTKVILENIQRKYASELFGIELVGYGNVYKFISKKTVFPYAQQLFGVSKPNTLSQSALETLAIIAYKQPVTRVEIEELRGVGAEMMLRKLQARNLIREAGRSEAPGRPILYEVTEEFMDSFKLYTLNELPDLPEYKNDQEENKDLFE